MAIFFTAVEKMITLFLYIVVGYILRKKELISDGFTNGIVKVLMLVGMPAMVLNTFQTDISPEIVKVGLNVFLLTCVAYGISYIVGFATAKLFKIERYRHMDFFRYVPEPRLYGLACNSGTLRSGRNVPCGVRKPRLPDIQLYCWRSGHF